MDVAWLVYLYAVAGCSVAMALDAVYRGRFWAVPLYGAASGMIIAIIVIAQR